MELLTPRLRLVNCDLPLIEAVLAGNAALAAHTGWQVPDDWTEFGEPIFHYTKARLLDHPADARWWSWLPVLREGNVLVGSCGYKGRPDAEGVVELGYEVAAHRRRQGLATELALALRDHAFAQAEVTRLIAHTLPELNPSTRVLKHLGMEMTGQWEDDDEGPVWRWEIDRETFEAL